jgi:hypothetical protein
MAGLFEKLNLTDQQEILVLHAPESFQPELARLPVLTIHHHIESVAEIGFLLAFVTQKSEVDALAEAVAARTAGNAIVWFAYPTSALKKFASGFNRDTGWDALEAEGFDNVRTVALDEDWTASRFQRRESIQPVDNGLRKITEATEPAPQATKKEAGKNRGKPSPAPSAPRKPKPTSRRTNKN